MSQLKIFKVEWFDKSGKIVEELNIPASTKKEAQERAREIVKKQFGYDQRLKTVITLVSKL